MTEKLTIAELGERVNAFADITSDFERTANCLFIGSIHASLNDGGIWAWPAAGELYRRAGDGFERVLTRTEKEPTL